MKWLLRYLKETSNAGLMFNKSNEEINLKGFVDLDFAGNNNNQKSISAYVFSVYYKLYLYWLIMTCFQPYEPNSQFLQIVVYKYPPHTLLVPFL